jgi:hypothetical protein
MVGSLEPLSDARVESTIIDRATNLKEQVGAASQPPHLLTFVHPAIHQITPVPPDLDVGLVNVPA